MRLQRGDGRYHYAGGVSAIVAIATRASVVNQAPTSGSSEMVQMLVRMDALQSTMASLARRVTIVEMEAEAHRHGRIDRWVV
jgi:hypothetical protein